MPGSKLCISISKSNADRLDIYIEYNMAPGNKYIYGWTANIKDAAGNSEQAFLFGDDNQHEYKTRQQLIDRARQFYTFYHSKSEVKRRELIARNQAERKAQALAANREKAEKLARLVTQIQASPSLPNRQLVWADEEWDGDQQVGYQSDSSESSGYDSE